jgi:hypothetical protein
MDSKASNRGCIPDKIPHAGGIYERHMYHKRTVYPV